MQIDHKIVRNILVVRNDRFGEFLLNIPAFRALKEVFINARLIAVIDPYVKELAQSIPFIDEIIEWARAKHSLITKLHFIELLRRRHIDIAIMLNPSKEFNIFTNLAGIPIRVGYDRKWGFLLTHKMEDKKYLGNKHEIDYNLELVNLIGAETRNKTLSLKIDTDIENNLLNDFGIKYSRNLVALHPWTSDPTKQWPIGNFYELAKRLIQELNINVIIVGGKEQLNKSLELFKGFGIGLLNFTGKTTLRQLAGILKKCRLLISGDSGPVHLAASVGTQVVVMFRSDIPSKNAKRWGPSGDRHIVIENTSLDKISVDEVFQKITEALTQL